MKRVSLVLSLLVVLDFTLATVGFAFPQLWFTIFHGVDFADPQGLLRRAAASWLAFAVLQTVALLRWRQAPYWLVLIAGVRLSDCLTDWTYLAFAHDITWFGLVSLIAVSPANLALGIYFLRCRNYVHLAKTSA